MKIAKVGTDAGTAVEDEPAPSNAGAHVEPASNAKKRTNRDASMSGDLDSIGVFFDQIDTEAMPGLFLSAMVAFGSFVLTLFAASVAGRFDGGTRESQRTIESTIDLGHGEPELVTEVVTDRFSLAGTLWLMKIGVAPVLKRFQS